MAKNGLTNVLIGISKSLKHYIVAWIAKTDKHSLFSLALISGDILAPKSTPTDDLNKYLPIGLAIIIILNTLILIFRRAPKVYEAWNGMLLKFEEVQHKAAEKHESETKRHQMALRQAGVHASVEEYYQSFLVANERYKDDSVACEIAKALALKELKLMLWENYYINVEVKDDKIHIKFE